MNRDVDRKFSAWMTSRDRRPLLVRGARQVGKTFSIKAFGSKQFGSMVVLDLERQRRLHAAFSEDLSPQVLLPQLEAQARQRIVPGETLLFLDEIQACPRALMALRYFHELMPELHVISAGSLLEFALADVSFPVGHVESLWMHPMTLSEFLIARGMGILDAQRPTLDTALPLPDATHNMLLDELRRYFLVGGMPDAVKAFTETNSLTETTKVHEVLTQTYQEDFCKYAGRTDRDCLLRVFEQVPARIGEQIKYTRLYPEKRVETIKGALRVLEKALVISKVSSTSAQGLPLGVSASDKVFKYICLDIGLVRHMCGFPADSVLMERNLLDTFRGSLAEQFVGQEMLAERAGSEKGKLYYWARDKHNSSAEVDYLMVRNGQVVPIEVKSGPSGRLRSMHVFLQEHPDIAAGLVLNASNVQVTPGQELRFMPIYTRLADGGTGI